ncbi:MAG: ATP-binding protein, partial [Pseudomonadota bacterium]
RTGLLLCGAILCFIAIALALPRLWQAALGARLQTVAQVMITHDRRAAFVTSETGQVLAANAAARERFGDISGAKLEGILGRMLANPAAVIDNLIDGAKADGATTEDIVTRRGHFRLQLVYLSPKSMLWSLEDLQGTTANNSAARSAGAFPTASLDADGQVKTGNAAMRKLLGARPATLADIVNDLPLRSGHMHKVRGRDGEVEMLAVTIAGADGLSDLYLLPGASVAQIPRRIEADWDAIEDLPVPLLKIAHDGTLIASNREARQLLHIKDINVRRLADVLDGPGRPLNDWLSEALVGRANNVSQFLRGRGENQNTFVQVTLNTAEEDGKPPHLIAVLNDVTELKTLEAQFVQSQKMQAIGQLAGGIAHDFNNLLTAISGHCDLLLRHHDEGDQNYSDLIQIHQNANRAASLVGQLLAFSRKQNLLPETIDLRDTLSDLTHLLNRLVGEKVTLTLEHEPELASIKADKRQLEQVLMNLVVNARDAMNGSGEIRIVTENRTLTSEMSRDRAVVPAGEYVVVSVIDEGHGIPAEKLPKIFEPFWTTKQPGEGTGLGLSTAYGIVKQTGGFIFADSEVGKGTTFSLIFPRFVQRAVAPIMVAPRVQEIAPSQMGGVVLLVEDEAPVRAFASRALRLRGYTVLEADCAEAALVLLDDADLSVDVFVTDVIMPGMDGPTWVREALKARPNTRVVFVSGYPEDAFDDGEPTIPDAVFLPKPFSLNDLTQTVAGQLQGPLQVASTLPGGVEREEMRG